MSECHKESSPSVCKFTYFPSNTRGQSQLQLRMNIASVAIQCSKWNSSTAAPLNKAKEQTEAVHRKADIKNQSVVSATSRKLARPPLFISGQSSKEAAAAPAQVKRTFQFVNRAHSRINSLSAHHLPIQCRPVCDNTHHSPTFICSESTIVCRQTINFATCTAASAPNGKRKQAAGPSDPNELKQ